ANSLTSGLSRRSRYLDRLSPAGVVALRDAGATAALRDRLREGVDVLLAADPKDLNGASERILANLETAFSEYDLRLERLLADERSFLRKGSYVLSNVVFSLAGPLSGNYALSLLGAITNVTGLPTIKDLWQAGRKIVKEGKAL